jgi:hypothetical protein
MERVRAAAGELVVGLDTGGDVDGNDKLYLELSCPLAAAP